MKPTKIVERKKLDYSNSVLKQRLCKGDLMLLKNCYQVLEENKSDGKKIEILLLKKLLTSLVIA